MTLSLVQTDATLLDVTCCVRLHTLLHVVVSCCAKFETGQTFEPTTPNISFVLWSPKRSATILDPFSQLSQHFWSRARALYLVHTFLFFFLLSAKTALEHSLSFLSVQLFMREYVITGSLLCMFALYTSWSLKRSRPHMWWLVVGSCFLRFFFLVLRFPPLLKNQNFKFQSIFSRVKLLPRIHRFYFPVFSAPSERTKN